MMRASPFLGLVGTLCDRYQENSSAKSDRSFLIGIGLTIYQTLLIFKLNPDNTGSPLIRAGLSKHSAGCPGR